MKILHILYQSIPNQKGSSIRSRDIVMSQRHAGMEPIVVTSPFQRGYSEAPEETIEGVKYYRTYNGRADQEVSERGKPLSVRISKVMSIFRFAWRVAAIARREKADVIHAHATFYCGLAGKFASLVLRKPFVYEVRSLWEEREKARAAGLSARLQVRAITFAETLIMNSADKVVAINHNLRDNLVGRRVDPGDVLVIPNAVNPLLIDDGKARPQGPLRFGYIGSISPIEGLDMLLSAFSRLRAEGYGNELFFFGDGPSLPELRIRRSEAGVEGVHFMGSLVPEKIAEAYGNVDVIVNPRRRSKLTDSVTPIKPLEGMAYRKLVLVSGVGGMRELVRDGDTGLMFAPDDEEDLRRRLLEILLMPAQRISEIVDRGHKHVMEEKSWLKNASLYRSLYGGLLGKSAKSGAD